MENLESKSIVNAEKGESKLYREIVRSKHFSADKSDINLTTVFCLAVAMGLKDKNFKTLGNKEFITRTEYIKKDSTMMSFLQAVAVAHTNSLEILNDTNSVFEIAEAYANGGIRKLYALIFNQGVYADFEKIIESESHNLKENLK